MYFGLVILLFALMLATVGVLVTGVIVMARGGEASQKYSNKLMTARVTLQGATLALVVLLLAMRGH